MADKQVIIGIKIEGTQQALSDMARLNAEIEQSKKLTKELSETDKTAAEQQKIITKQKVEAYNQIAKETKATVDAGNAEIKTLATMRAELGRLNKVAENAKFGSDAFKKAQEEATKLRKEINNADQAAGKFQGNVGNYKGAIIDAFQSMGINVSKYTELISTATTVTSAFSTSTTVATGAASGFTVALRAMALAIAATGIGAIIILLGLLTTAFFSTEEGADFYEKKMSQAKQVTNSLWAEIQKLSVALTELNGEKIKQSLSVLTLWIFQFGLMSGAASKTGKNVFDLKEQLEELKITIASKEYDITRQMSEQKEIYTNVLKTDLERKTAAEKFLSLNKEITGLKIQEAQLEFDIANKSKVTSRTYEDKLRLAQLASELDKRKKESIDEELKTRKFLNGLEKESLGTQKDALKVEEERRKSLGYTAIEMSKLAIEVEKMAKAFVTDIKKLPEVDEILFESIQKGVDLASEATKGITSEYDIRLQALNDALDNEAIDQKEHSEAMKQLNAEYSVAIVTQTADMFNGLAEIAGKNSKAGKAFSAASILMQTYVSAMLAFRAGLELGGPLGLPLGIAQAAIATAFGLKQIQQLYSVKEPKQPKYAHGVIGLQGAGSETSDSINARLSKGESVMTAKATRVFAPMLADMELAVGNRPNFQMGRRRFASGFIPNTNIMGNSEQIIRETIKAIGMIPVVVSETDITSTQARVRKIMVTSDL